MVLYNIVSHFISVFIATGFRGMTPNTREINARRKSEKPKKQRKAKEVLVEGCAGLDGDKCLEIGPNSRRSADV